MNRAIQDIHGSQLRIQFTTEFWEQCFIASYQPIQKFQCRKSLRQEAKIKYIHIKRLGFKTVSISQADCINLQDIFVVFMWNCSEKYKPSSWRENSCLTCLNSETITLSADAGITHSELRNLLTFQLQLLPCHRLHKYLPTVHASSK